MEVRVLAAINIPPVRENAVLQRTLSGAKCKDSFWQGGFSAVYFERSAVRGKLQQGTRVVRLQDEMGAVEMGCFDFRAHCSGGYGLKLTPM